LEDLGNQVNQGNEDLMDHQDLQAHLDQKVYKVQKATQEKMVLLVHQAEMEYQDLEGLLDRREIVANLDHKDHLDL